jgi:flagellar hook-associated protein 1 FlgK
MADMLSTAVSALQTFRRGLDTTSHNIANVGTEGYSRQRAELATRPAQPYANGWIGSGVATSTIQRSYDQFVALQYRSTSSSLERQDAYASLAERVSNLFADPQTGLSTTLQKFANALQGVANAPTSIPARQVLLSEAGAFAGQMVSYGSRLAQMSDEVNQNITAGVSEVNSLAQGIAQLNEQIVAGVARTGQPPNDLLDQRDTLVDQLSRKVGLSTVMQTDGAMNVFVGTGQPLVLGTQAAKLEVTRDAYDASRLQVAVRTPSGAVDITRNLTGGEIGGLLDFRTEMLDPARNSLGQMAAGLTELVNDAQAAGMDLNGALGSDLFSVGAPQVLPNAMNTGTGRVDATVSAASQLTTADYYLEFDGSAWSLQRADTGATVTLSGTGSVANPLSADGLSLVISGTPSAGDRFLVRPTQAAASGMQVLISDPSKLAAALPVAASYASTNTGNAKPAGMSVLDAADPNLRTTASINFLTATTYTVNGGPVQTFTPGSPLAANGWSLQLDGTPAAGDSFTVRSNLNGVGDNGNFLALADALKKPFLNGNTASIGDSIGSFVASVGVQTRQSQISRDALELVQRDSVAAKASVSGVNLDEEAANLMRYQQAYQAAAQVVQISNDNFQTLLAAVSR